MKFILDITQCTDLKYIGLPESAKKIPIVPGRIAMHFDVLECEIPKDAYAALYALHARPDTDVVFGLQIHSIPLGAVITRVE